MRKITYLVLLAILFRKSGANKQTFWQQEERVRMEVIRGKMNELMLAGETPATFLDRLQRSVLRMRNNFSYQVFPTFYPTWDEYFTKIEVVDTSVPAQEDLNCARSFFQEWSDDKSLQSDDFLWRVLCFNDFRGLDQGLNCPVGELSSVMKCLADESRWTEEQVSQYVDKFTWHYSVLMRSLAKST